MARVNINILGISELKWMGMGEFNSDDHYIYYCGQESHRENGVAIIVNKRVQNAVPGCNLKKTQNDLCSFPRQTIQYHNNGSLCQNHWCWRSWSWMDLLRPTRPSRTNTKKRCPFHQQGLEGKVGSQEISGITDKFGLGVQNEAGQSLTKFCQENTLVTGNTLFQQHNTRDDSTHGHHQMRQCQNHINYMLCSWRWRSSIESAKKWDGEHM